MLCIDCPETNTMQLPCTLIFQTRAFTDQVVSEFIAFAYQTKEQQEKILIKDVYMPFFIGRGQEQVGKLQCFLLPASFNHLICIGAYSRLIGYGREAMIMVKKHAEGNTTPSHGLKG